MVELMRNSSRNVKDALECARRLFSLKFGYHLTLNTERKLKHHLLALIYPENDENSPVGEIWSIENRNELAARVRHRLLLDLGAPYPNLLLIIRYFSNISDFVSNCSNSDRKVTQIMKYFQESTVEAPLEKEQDAADMQILFCSKVSCR
jgi:hypothetical protein